MNSTEKTPENQETDKAFFANRNPRGEGAKFPVEIAEQLSFIRSLLDEHAVREPKIEADWRRLNLRQQDPSLYVGVVGEFSAGKSTFLNALLGDALLRTDVLQGTTAAATFLKSAAEIFAEVHHLGGGVDRFQLGAGQTREDLLAWIHAFSADEQHARTVSKVLIGHPASILDDGLVIIDLPGLNAENERHLTVTLRSVRQDCDAFLVVVPATSPASEMLLSFLRTNLSGMLHRCIFVVTKADLISGEPELQRIQENIRARLVAGLELQHDPVILTVAPEIALCTQLKTDPNEGRPRLLAPEAIQRFSDCFDASKAQIIELAQERRLVTMLDAILANLGALLALVEASLARAHANSTRRVNELKAVKIHDVEQFVAAAKKGYEKQVRRQLEPSLGAARLVLERFKDQSRAKLAGAIQTAVTKEELRTRVHSTWNHLAKLLEPEIRPVMTRARDELEQVADEAARGCRDEFQKFYGSLLGVDGKSICEGPRAPVIEPVTTLMLPVGMQLDANLSRVLKSSITWVHWVFGTLICFPFGLITVVLMNQSANKCDQSVRNPVEAEALQKLDEVVAALGETMENGLSTLCANLCRAFESRLDALAREYAEPLRKMSRDNAEERRVLTQYQSRAGTDLTEIGARRRLLEQMRAQCLMSHDLLADNGGRHA